MHKYLILSIYAYCLGICRPVCLVVQKKVNRKFEQFYCVSVYAIRIVQHYLYDNDVYIYTTCELLYGKDLLFYESQFLGNAVQNYANISLSK